MSEYWKYNKEFKGKVDYAMVKVAIAVMAEDSGTDSHAERVVYAKGILNGEEHNEEIYRAFATNSTIKAHLVGNTDYTDDLAFVATTLYNALAGVAT